MPGSVPGTGKLSLMVLHGHEFGLLQPALSPQSSQAQFWSGEQSQGLFLVGGLNAPACFGD